MLSFLFSALLLMHKLVSSQCIIKRAGLEYSHPPLSLVHNIIAITEYAISTVHVVIETLKVRYDVIKLDLVVPLLSLWCIDIDLSIQLTSLILYMTWVY